MEWAKRSQKAALRVPIDMNSRTESMTMEASYSGATLLLPDPWSKWLKK